MSTAATPREYFKAGRRADEAHESLPAVLIPSVADNRSVPAVRSG
ncbi:MAG: hypothetical protein ACRDUV_19270 [Pseudonocardiaceae bacterium]